MKSSASYLRLNRREMLSALTALPAFITLSPAGALAQTAAADGPLPSWNDNPSKSAIMTFVDRVTKQGSPDFVPEAERIATFDHDGTLWAEQPMYFQLLFALCRVKQLAPQCPEWETTEPFASLLKGDVKDALAGDEPTIVPIVRATHTGMTSEEVDQIVRDWIATAKHPITGQAYTEIVYRPMLELVAFLRANGFKMRYGDGVALHSPAMLCLTISS